MSLSAVKILGINITISSKKEILEELKKSLFSGEKTRSKTIIIATPNPEQIVLAKKDSQFAKMLNRADVTVPDGIGVVWAHRFLGGRESIARIPGVELMMDLVSQASKQRVPVALIGGRGNLAIDALECLQKEYHGLKGIALSCPEMRVSQKGLELVDGSDLYEALKPIVSTIERKRVRMIFVALGAPKQEYMISHLAPLLARLPQPILLMSVGGSLDIITNRTPRAPLWMRRLGWEWFWRLMYEPWRIKRQAALLEFVRLVVKERVATK